MVTSVPFLIARIPDDNDFLKLKEMVNVHDDWNLDYDKYGVKIWSKSVPDAAIKMVKVWSIFSSVSSSDLYCTLMDPLYRKHWDTHMILTYEIGYLNPNNGISYYAVSCPPPLKSRDFVLQTSWLDRGNEHYIINHSVCHKDHPPKRGFIRAISYFTGYFIKCLPVQGCEMSFISQTDPQGVIPAWLVNKVTQILAPRFVKQLEKAAFDYSNWKKQNQPDLVPWVSPEHFSCPKITIEDCVPSEEELQSPFYKYLMEKASKSVKSSPKKEDFHFHVHFSQSENPSSSSFTTVKAGSSKYTTISENLNETKPQDKKSKKSKGQFWLNLVKLCFGKDSES